MWQDGSLRASSGKIIKKSIGQKNDKVFGLFKRNPWPKAFQKKSPVNARRNKFTPGAGYLKIFSRPTSSSVMQEISL
jgi:hypothetical protein